MSYALEKIHGEPIVLFTGHRDFHVARELDKASHEVVRLLDAQSEPVFLIQDELRQPVPDVEEMIEAGGALAVGNHAIYRHPMLAGVIIVTQNEVTHALYDGLDSDIYGHVHVRIVETLEDAFAYARENY